MDRAKDFLPIQDHPSNCLKTQLIFQYYYKSG
jgi:hypothetical protein